MLTESTSQSCPFAAGFFMRTNGATFSAVGLATGFIVVVFISTFSCSRSVSPKQSAARDSAKHDPKDGAPTDAPKLPPEPSAPDSSTDPAASATEKESPSLPDGPRSQQQKPSGKPSPTAICGHAVAYAGWSPQGDGARDRLFLCDPGDNELEGRSAHGWDAQPREVPIRFGKRRPNIVLLPAGVFTITGAVVISETNRSPVPPQDRDDIIAKGIPDLSQNGNPNWLGLCGSTAGADILFFMAQEKTNVLPECLRGPSAEADAQVIKILTGDRNEILPQSLAGLMKTGPDGFGTTNLGMRQGMESWLDKHDAGSWVVELDWLSDEEKPREKQREFFDRLAAGVRGGGGAIICLWPGSEFSDAATGDADSEPIGTASDSTSPESAPQKPSASKTGAPVGHPPRGKSEPFPDSDFPVPTSTASDRPVSLSGRRNTKATAEEALEQARQQMSEARDRLGLDQSRQAFEHATQAVSLLHEHSTTDAACRAELAQAIALCRKIEARLPRPSEQSLKKQTLFQ